MTRLRNHYEVLAEAAANFQWHWYSYFCHWQVPDRPSDNVPARSRGNHGFEDNAEYDSFPSRRSPH